MANSAEVKKNLFLSKLAIKKRKTTSFNLSPKINFYLHQSKASIFINNVTFLRVQFSQAENILVSFKTLFPYVKSSNTCNFSQINQQFLEFLV